MLSLSDLRVGAVIQYYPGGSNEVHLVLNLVGQKVTTLFLSYPMSSEREGETYVYSVDFVIEKFVVTC